MPATAPTVRIRPETRETLRELEHQTHLGTQEILARAVDAFRRSVILADTDIAYARARNVGDDFSDITEWDATVGDGLHEEDVAAPAVELA